MPIARVEYIVLLLKIAFYVALLLSFKPPQTNLIHGVLRRWYHLEQDFEIVLMSISCHIQPGIVTSLNGVPQGFFRQIAILSVVVIAAQEDFGGMMGRRSEIKVKSHGL